MIMLLVIFIVIVIIFIVIYYRTYNSTKNTSVMTVNDTLLFRSGVKTEKHPHYGIGSDLGLSVDGIEGSLVKVKIGNVYHIDSDQEIELYSEEDNTVHRVKEFMIPELYGRKELIYRIKNQPYSGGKILIY